MEQKSVFKEILREYDRQRQQSKRLLLEREKEVHNKIPEIFEIDNILNNTGISIAKKILSKDGNSVELVKELELNNKKLIAKKNDLLVKNGYSVDYFTNIYKCNVCKDNGFIGTEKCFCFKQKLINNYYSLSNLSSILSIENFDTFEFKYYSDEEEPNRGISPLKNIQKIYQSALAFVRKFDTEYNNLLFYGPSGLGKTFLCNCIAKDILDLGKTVLYVTAPQIFKIIEEYRFNRSDLDEPNEYIGLVLTVDLLIIDDLGTEFSTSVTTSELFNIINTRILDKKKTIISTNLYPGDFENQYSDRITSRFFGNYTMFHFFGDDIRVLKKYTR